MGVKHMKGEHGLERAKYECDVCGKVDYWAKGWAWFGSHSQVERGEEVPLVCSTGCMDKYAEIKSGAIK